MNIISSSRLLDLKTKQDLHPKGKYYANLAPLKADTVSFKGDNDNNSPHIHLEWIDNPRIRNLVEKILPTNPKCKPISSAELISIVTYFGYYDTGNNNGHGQIYKLYDYPDAGSNSNYTIKTKVKQVNEIVMSQLREALSIIDDTNGELMSPPRNRQIYALEEKINFIEGTSEFKPDGINNYRKHWQENHDNELKNIENVSRQKLEDSKKEDIQEYIKTKQLQQEELNEKRLLLENVLFSDDSGNVEESSKILETFYSDFSKAEKLLEDFQHRINTASKLTEYPEYEYMKKPCEDFQEYIEKINKNYFENDDYKKLYTVIENARNSLLYDSKNSQTRKEVLENFCKDFSSKEQLESCLNEIVSFAERTNEICNEIEEHEMEFLYNTLISEEYIEKSVELIQRLTTVDFNEFIQNINSIKKKLEDLKLYKLSREDDIKKIKRSRPAPISEFNQGLKNLEARISILSNKKDKLEQELKIPFDNMQNYLQSEEFKNSTHDEKMEHIDTCINTINDKVKEFQKIINTDTITELEKKADELRDLLVKTLDTPVRVVKKSKKSEQQTTAPVKYKEYKQLYEEKHDTLIEMRKEAERFYREITGRTELLSSNEVESLVRWIPKDKNDDSDLKNRILRFINNIDNCMGEVNGQYRLIHALEQEGKLPDEDESKYISQLNLCDIKPLKKELSIIQVYINRQKTSEKTNLEPETAKIEPQKEAEEQSPQEIQIQTEAQEIQDIELPQEVYDMLYPEEEIYDTPEILSSSNPNEDNILNYIVQNAVTLESISMFADDIKAQARKVFSAQDFINLENASSEEFGAIMQDKIQELSTLNDIKQIRRAQIFAIMSASAEKYPQMPPEKMYNASLNQIIESITTLSNFPMGGAEKLDFNKITQKYEQYKDCLDNNEAKQIAKLFLSSFGNMPSADYNNLLLILANEGKYFKLLTDAKTHKDLKSMLLKMLVDDFDNTFGTNYSANIDKAVSNMEKASILNNMEMYRSLRNIW